MQKSNICDYNDNSIVFLLLGNYRNFTNLKTDILLQNFFLQTSLRCIYQFKIQGNCTTSRLNKNFIVVGCISAKFFQ